MVNALFYNTPAEALLNGWCANLNSGFMNFYTGVQPAMNGALTGTLLASLGFGSTAFATAAESAGYVYAIANAIASGSVVANGTPGYCALLESNGTTVVATLSVGTAGAGADITVSSSSLVAGALMSCSSFSVALPQGAIPAGPTLVQETDGAGLSKSFGSATTSGNTLVVVVTDAAANTVSAVTLGGAAGNFTKIKEVSVADAMVSVWVDANCAGGQTAIAATESGSLTPHIWAYEFQGTRIVDQSAGASGVSAGWSVATSASTLVPNEAWIAAVSSNNGYAISAINGSWTNENGYDYLFGSSVIGECQSSYQIVTATGVATYSGTTYSYGNWAAAVITIR